MAKHELIAVVSHFVQGTRADCTCGWSSAYVDTGDVLADTFTAANAHEAHVAKSKATPSPDREEGSGG